MKWFPPGDRVVQQMEEDQVPGHQRAVISHCLLGPWNHRIMGRLGLGGTLKDHLVQYPQLEQGHFSLDRVAQSPVLPDRALSPMGHSQLLWVTCSRVSPPSL